MYDTVKVCHAAVMMEDKLPLIVNVNVRTDGSSYLCLYPSGVYIAVHSSTLLLYSPSSFCLGGTPFVQTDAHVTAIRQHAAAATGGNN